MFGMTKPKTPNPEILPELAAFDMAGFETELEEALDTSSQETESLEPLELLHNAIDVSTGGSETVVPELKQSTSTRTNLAALAAFESEMRNAATSLDAMDTTLAAIGAAHETANRFLGNLRAGIHRANDLEEANTALLADNRRLSERLDQAKHLQSQLESADEVNKRRIELLIKDYDEAKVALGKSQIEVVEVRDALADADGEKTALIYELATKSTSVDRLTRELELLRQKFVNQQMANAELEQRHADLERKLEELSAIRKTEAVEMSELRMRFDNTEKENRRLQKQSDHSQVRLAETQERVMTLDADLEELRDRHAATSERFRSEAEVLKAKLETSARKNIADSDEIASLKQKLGEAVSVANVAQAQLASVNGQVERQRSSQPAPENETETETETIDRANSARSPKKKGPTSYARGRPAKKSKVPAEATRVNNLENRTIRTRKKRSS